MADFEQTPELKLDLVQFTQGWIDILDDQLHDGLDKYNIGKLDGDLWKSIMSNIIATGGDVQGVITRFLQYGRFVDMGVGRGVSIGDAGTSAFSKARNNDGTLKHYGRRPKHWYSKTYYHEVQRFAELYAAEFNKQIPVQITEALTGTIDIKI